MRSADVLQDGHVDRAAVVVAVVPVVVAEHVAELAAATQVVQQLLVERIATLKSLMIMTN